MKITLAAFGNVTLGLHNMLRFTARTILMQALFQE